MVGVMDCCSIVRTCKYFLFYFFI